MSKQRKVEFEPLNPEPPYSVVARWANAYAAMTPREKAAEDRKTAACKAAHAVNRRRFYLLLRWLADEMCYAG